MRTSRSVLQWIGTRIQRPHRWKWTRYALLLCAALALSSCHTPQTETGKKLADVGHEMDDAEKYLEDYGSISISTPLLSKLGEDFSFDLKEGGTNYYNDAKNQVQGAAASFQQAVQSFSGSGQVQLDPTVMMGYAAQLQNYFSAMQRFNTKQNLQDQADLQQLHANLAAANTNTDTTARSSAVAQALQAYSQQYNAPSNAPSYPTSGQMDTNLPSAPPTPGRPNVTNVLSSQQFLPFQGLISGLGVQPTISDREAIITAAGDVATESIFRHFMGTTNLDSENAEDNVFFGFSTINVDPGWRTSKGWAAEAVMKAEIQYEPARRVVLDRFATINPMGLKTNMLARLYRDMGYRSQSEFLQILQNERSKDSNLLNQALSAGTNRLRELGCEAFDPVAEAAAIGRQFELSTQAVDWLSGAFQEAKAEPCRPNNQTSFRNSIGATINTYIDTNSEWNTLGSNQKAQLNLVLGTFSNSIAKESNVAILDLQTTMLDVLTNSLSQTPKSDIVAESNIVVNLAVAASDTQAEARHQFVSSAVDAYASSNPAPTIVKAPDTNVFPAAEWVSQNTNTHYQVSATIISPLIDAAVLDLSSSTRYQNEFALATSFALRYAGLGAQASQFEQFVKSQQYDVRTRTAQVSVNAFSGADGRFGFQVAPRLTALGDPSKANSKPSQTLDRQSFPALLILRLGDGDLSAKLVSENGTNAFFSANNILDLETLVEKVSNSNDSMSRYLRSLAGDSWKAANDQNQERRILIRVLNRAVGDTGLIQANLVDRSLWREETLQLAEKLSREENPQLAEQRRLNRMILEDAYPTELSLNKLQLLEPCLRFTQIRRWTPIKHKYSYHDRWIAWINAVNWSHPALTEEHRLGAVGDLAEARSTFTNLWKKYANSATLSDSTSNSILQRIENLESQMAGGEGDVLLSASLIVPSTNKTTLPAITNVIPSALTLEGSRTNNPVQLVFFGTGLEQVRTGTNSPTNSVVSGVWATLWGVDTNNLTLQRAGSALVLTTSLQGISPPGLTNGVTNGFLAFQLNTTNKSALVTPPVALLALSPPPRTNEISIVFTQTFSTNSALGTTNEYRVNISTNATDSQVSLASGIIRAELEKHKPSDLQSSNNVLSILVNGNKQLPVGMSNTIVVPVSAPGK